MHFVETLHAMSPQNVCNGCTIFDKFTLLYIRSRIACKKIELNINYKDAFVRDDEVDNFEVVVQFVTNYHFSYSRQNLAKNRNPILPFLHLFVK